MPPEEAGRRADTVDPHTLKRAPAAAGDCPACRQADAALTLGSALPHGIRAVSVTVNGALAPDTRFSPDHVADALFAAAHQDPAAWADEVPFDGA